MTFAIFMLGFCVGMFVNELWHLLHRACGTLKVDTKNDKKDIYRLEIDDLDSITKKKCIVLKVDKNADLSQN